MGKKNKQQEQQEGALRQLFPLDEIDFNKLIFYLGYAMGALEKEANLEMAASARQLYMKVVTLKDNIVASGNVDTTKNGN